MKALTSFIRAEFSNNYCYVRNEEEKGGVICAIIKTKKQAELVKKVLSKVSGKSFSKVWDEMNTIKGVNFSYSSN